MTPAMKTDAQDAFWEIMAFFGPRLFLHEVRPRMREMIEAGMYAEAHFLATLCDEQRHRRAMLERGEEPEAPAVTRARDWRREG